MNCARSTATTREGLPEEGSYVGGVRGGWVRSLRILQPTKEEYAVRKSDGNTQDRDGILLGNPQQTESTMDQVQRDRTLVSAKQHVEHS